MISYQHVFCRQATNLSSPRVNPPESSSTIQRYCYRVKIINPSRKKDCVVRDMRKFRGRFSSLTELRVRLIEEFEYPQQSHSQLDIFQDVSQQNIGYTHKKI